jgi:hypothetical protein
VKEARGTVHLARPRAEVERHVLDEWMRAQKIARIGLVGIGAAGALTGAALRDPSTAVDLIEHAYESRKGQTPQLSKQDGMGFEVEMAQAGLVWRYESADTPDGVDVTVAYIYPGWEGRFVPHRMMDLSVRRYLDKLHRWSSGA